MRDTDRENGRCGATTQAGGDGGGREQVAVPNQPTVRAGHNPPGGLGDAPSAGGAGGGGAALVYQPHRDPGRLGLVPQCREEMADPPCASAVVVPPPGLRLQDAAGVADRQGADAVLNGPGDHLAGGFVLGLANPAAVPRLHHLLAAPVLAPPPRPALPGCGNPAGYRPAAGLGIPQVLVAFGTDRPPRHQQGPPARPGRRIRVNDPHIHPATWPGSGAAPCG